jgi:thymidylate synthase
VDFIDPYISRYRSESEDGGLTVYGGYGPRLFAQRGVDQISNVISLLRERPNSRRAVVQLFNAEDIADHHVEIPCTVSLQFFRRAGLVDLVAMMRSNDAYLGLPHDVFCFTMLQEIVAKSLDCEIGEYRHFVGSMHLYDSDKDDAEALIGEDFQSRVQMPAMPAGDPWKAIGAILEAESRIRNGDRLDADEYGLQPYWADLIRLLQVFFSKDAAYIRDLMTKMDYQRFRPYILSRITP